MEHSTNSINNGPDECSDSSRLTPQKHNKQHNPSKITRVQHISTEITPFNYSDESLNDKTAAPCQNQLRIRNKAAKTNQTVSLSKSNEESNHSQLSGNRNNGIFNAYTTDQRNKYHFNIIQQSHTQRKSEDIPLLMSIAIPHQNSSTSPIPNPNTNYHCVYPKSKLANSCQDYQPIPTRITERIHKKQHNHRHRQSKKYFRERSKRRDKIKFYQYYY